MNEENKEIEKMIEEMNEVIEEEQEEQETSFICQFCGKEYTLERYYKKHLKKCEEEFKAKKKQSEELHEKVEELKKPKTLTVPKSTTAQFSKLDWVWAQFEDIKTQMVMIYETNQEILKEIKIDQNVKRRLEVLIANSLSIMDKLISLESRPRTSPNISPSIQQEVQQEVQHIARENGITMGSQRIASPNVPQKRGGFVPISESNKPAFMQPPKHQPVRAQEQFPQSKTQFSPPKKEETYRITADIAGSTQRAILLRLSNGTETWIPKSTIKSPYQDKKNVIQTFEISAWIIKKNNLSNLVVD